MEYLLFVIWLQHIFKTVSLILKSSNLFLDFCSSKFRQSRKESVTNTLNGLRNLGSKISFPMWWTKNADLVCLITGQLKHTLQYHIIPDRWHWLKIENNVVCPSCMKWYLAWLVKETEEFSSDYSLNINYSTSNITAINIFY